MIMSLLLLPSSVRTRSPSFLDMYMMDGSNDYLVAVADVAIPSSISAAVGFSVVGTSRYRR